MIAGRFKWLEAGAKIPGKVGLAALDFPSGTLLLTEVATKKRASIHLARSLDEFRRGGIEPLDCTLGEFEAALRRENHTLKRALTDPRLFSGIGNAYSDEILHRARLSPLTWTGRLTDGESARLFDAARETLREWLGRLRAEVGDGFPEMVTATNHRDPVSHGQRPRADQVGQADALLGVEDGVDLPQGRQHRLAQPLGAAHPQVAARAGLGLVEGIGGQGVGERRHRAAAV